MIEPRLSRRSFLAGFAAMVASPRVTALLPEAAPAIAETVAAAATPAVAPPNIYALWKELSTARSRFRELTSPIVPRRRGPIVSYQGRLESNAQALASARYTFEHLLAAPEEELNKSWAQTLYYMDRFAEGSYAYTALGYDDSMGLVSSASLRSLLGLAVDQPLPLTMDRPTLLQAQQRLEAHYAQCIDICTPHIPADELADLRDKFESKRIVRDSLTVRFAPDKIVKDILAPIENLLVHDKVRITVEPLPAGQSRLIFHFDHQLGSEGPYWSDHQATRVEICLRQLQMHGAPHTVIEQQFTAAKYYSADQLLGSHRTRFHDRPVLERLTVTSSDPVMAELATTIRGMLPQEKFVKFLHDTFKDARMRRVSVKLPAANEIVQETQRSDVAETTPASPVSFQLTFPVENAGMRIAKNFAIKQAKTWLAADPAYAGIQLTPMRDGCRITVENPAQHPELLRQFEAEAEIPMSPALIPEPGAAR